MNDTVRAPFSPLACEYGFSALLRHICKSMLQVVHLMRHGVTEMNVYLSTNRYGSKGFRDPLLYDTRLTARGKLGAEAAAAKVRKLRPEPQLLVVSPLTRALQTATLAFGPQLACPVLVEPLLRERLYLSSDVGRHPQELAQEFPEIEFSHLPDVWWHSNSPEDPAAVHEEPEDVFDARMEQLYEWLQRRPESCIAVVSHWGCLHALTGYEFRNCELHTTRLSRMLAGRQKTQVFL
eukprot:gene7810-8007_t